VHAEATELLRKAGAPASPPAPSPRSPARPSAARAAWAAAQQGRAGGPGPSPAEEEPPPRPGAAATAAAAAHGAPRQAGGGRAHLAARHEAPQQPEQPAWAGSLRQLRGALAALRQQEGQAAAAEALGGRMRLALQPALVPAGGRQLLRACVSRLLRDLAAGVAACSAQAAAALASPEASHTRLPGAAAAAPGQVPKPAALQQLASQLSIGAAAAAAQQEQEQEQEQERAQQQRRRFRQLVRQAAGEALGALEPELLLLRQAAADAVQEQLQECGAGSGEEGDWRAFALHRALQRSAGRW
jgi:hypothetical protein